MVNMRVRGIPRLKAHCFPGDSFKFEKRPQLLIATSDKPFSVVPMRVNNPDRSPSEATAET
jgi:hypothetical protein